MPFTIGIAFDLVPAVVFLHVFLAFPSGRLEHGLERALLLVGYVTAFALQLVAMALDGFGPDNLLEVASEPGTEPDRAARRSSSCSARCAWLGVGILAARRRSAGRPLRRSLPCSSTPSRSAS